MVDSAVKRKKRMMTIFAFVGAILLITLLTALRYSELSVPFGIKLVDETIEVYDWKASITETYAVVSENETPAFVLDYSETYDKLKISFTAVIGLLLGAIFLLSLYILKKKWDIPFFKEGPFFSVKIDQFLKAIRIDLILLVICIAIPLLLYYQSIEESKEFLTYYFY